MVCACFRPKMSGKPQVVEVVISELDWHIINRAKELRIRKKLSQSDLSIEMGFSEKLIGSVENPTLKAKFNVRQLNLLARALRCTLWEIIPEKPFTNDLMRVRVKRIPKLNNSGKPTSKTEFRIIDI